MVFDCMVTVKKALHTSVELILRTAALHNIDIGVSQFISRYTNDCGNTMLD